MGSLSATNFFDVLKNKPRERTAVADGERRIIKRPEGRAVEEWVDPSGNVVWLQMLHLGTPEGQEAIDKKRMELRRMGFLEHDKCPLKHGSRHSTPKIEEEFAELPEELARPCTAEPVRYVRKGKHTHASDPCCHITWLIASRRERAAAERDLRATKIETAADLERQQLGVAEQTLAETRAQTQMLVEALGRTTTGEGGGGKRKKDRDDKKDE